MQRALVIHIVGLAGLPHQGIILISYFVICKYFLAKLTRFWVFRFFIGWTWETYSRYSAPTTSRPQVLCVLYQLLVGLGFDFIKAFSVTLL